MRRTLPPNAAYLFYAGGSGLFFACYGTLANVYRIEVAHLDALQLVLVGTVLESAVVLFEVPTGVLADAVSRRLSVVLGLALMGGGFLLEGALPVFGTILLAQLLWGVGSTFESGAVDAWIADELGEERAPRSFLRAAQVSQGTALLGIGLAAVLGRGGLAWPLLAAGAGFLVLAVALTAVMGETGFRPPPAGAADGERFGRLRATFAAGMQAARTRRLVRWILALALLAGAASEVFDRLWQAQLLRFPLPLAGQLGQAGFFGAIAATALVLSMVATEVARRRVDASDHRATALALMALAAALAGALVGFGFAGDARSALGFYFVVVLLRRVNAPLFRAWLNQSASAGVRATLFSFANQMDALGQIVAGPLLGWLALRAGMPWAFAACSALLVAAVAIYARALGMRGGPRQPGEAAS